MNSAAKWILTHQWAILPDMLETIVGIAERDHSASSIIDALQKQDADPLPGTRKAEYRDGIAILSVVGPIFPRANLFTAVSGAQSLQTLAKDFNAALENQSIGGIMMVFDTPGGEVTGVNEMASMIREARAIKPITAYVGGVGASAGYWLLAAAGEVVIAETALVGSIGVVQVSMAKDKASIEIVSSRAPNKRPDPESDAGKASILATLNAIEDVFVNSVAASRNVAPEKVTSDFGQGGVLVGKEAVKAGMADSVGTFESAFADLKRKIQVRKTFNVGGN